MTRISRVFGREVLLKDPKISVIRVIRGQSLRATNLVLCAVALLIAGPASARPVVAILAQNDGTEITDFLVPYGVLASSGAADVVAVSREEGPVELVPGPILSGVTILADTTLEKFDRAHPRGADFVIVPAFLDAENAVTRGWLQGQAAKGATLVSICDGAIVVAGTGLLDGHRATGHFASAGQRRKQFPNVHWMANTRFVDDGKFISSSGVSASLPAALYLVELLAGRTRALEVARAQGLADYRTAHDSHAFHMGIGDLWVGAKNYLFGWPRDVYALELAPGVDEVGLGFAIDMLSRTFRATVAIVAPTNEVPTRYGLRVVRSALPSELPARAVRVRIGGSIAAPGLRVGEGAHAAPDVLAYLTQHYGDALSTFVAMQLEYPSPQPQR
jgi:putative intracellular protease/amidase